MLRGVLGFVAGSFTAGIVAGLIQRIGLSLYPPTDGGNSEALVSFKTYLETAPVPALLLILLAGISAALAGSWIAIRTSQDPRSKGPAIGVGFMVLIGGARLAVYASERLWFGASMVAGILLATSIPILAGYRKPAIASEEDTQTSG